MSAGAPDQRGPTRQRLHAIGLLIVVAVLLALVGIAQTFPGKSALREAGLTAPSLAYTELAFTHPMRLPGQVPIGRSSLTVPFTVHNVEADQVAYDWVVTESLGAQATTLASGRVALHRDARASLEPTVALICTGDRVRVDVHLLRHSQAIGFWARCGRPTKQSILRG